MRPGPSQSQVNSNGSAGRGLVGLALHMEVKEGGGKG